MLNNIVKLAVWKVAGIGAASAAVTAGVGYGLHLRSVKKTQEELETLKAKQTKQETDVTELQKLHSEESKSLREEIQSLRDRIELETFTPLTPESINEMIVNLKRGVELVTPVATDALKTVIPVVIGAVAEIKLATMKAEKDVMEKVETDQKVNEEFIASEKAAVAS